MTARAHTVVAAARSYLATPWRHQGRTPGRGLDCGGIIVCAFAAAGLVVADSVAYSRLPRPELMLDTLARTFYPVAVTHLTAADVVYLRIADMPQHLALYTGTSIVHAYAPMRRTVEHRLDESWRPRVISAWRHPGLAR